MSQPAHLNTPPSLSPSDQHKINYLTNPFYSSLAAAEKLEKANTAYKSQVFLAQSAQKHFRMYHETLHSVYARIHALPHIYPRGTLQPNNMEDAAEIWQQFTGGHALDLEYLKWGLGMYREKWAEIVGRANEIKRQMLVLSGLVAAEERAAKEAAKRRRGRWRKKEMERRQRGRSGKEMGKG